MTKHLSEYVLYEASRSIPLEQREWVVQQIMQYRRKVETEKRDYPERQEKRVHHLSELLSEAFETNAVITVVTCGIFRNQEYSGIIIKLDLREEKMLLECGEVMQWIHFSSILHVY